MQKCFWPTFLFISVLTFSLSVGNPNITPSDSPIGSLDVANVGIIAGWAKDPDYNGPINVHIYVDGTLMKALLAGDFRSDVGNHGFNWAPPPFGKGPHEVIVYAIGVNNSGEPNNDNPSLSGSPKSFDAGCQGLTGAELDWCNGVSDYWQNRQRDTELIGNNLVRVGVNRSFGGTIFELYDDDWQSNLTLEHGGGAIQLSIWGYDPVGSDRWFAVDTCNTTPYLTKEECLTAGNKSCVLAPYHLGRHVSDCISSKPCTGWYVGAPWNPIQAQGPDCGWSSEANDVIEARSLGNTYYTRHNFPYHFTSTQPPAPMDMEQWVTPHQGYVEIIYRISYYGSIAWSIHPQEIPAIFTAEGMNVNYYYYDGDKPFSGDGVTHRIGLFLNHLRFPGKSKYIADDYIGYAREGWWGVCDEGNDRCLTVAAFDTIINEVDLSNNRAGAGYITPLGHFPLQPGMDLKWTIYIFPYRYNEVLAGKTVRQIIYELATPEFRRRTDSLKTEITNRGQLSPPEQFALYTNYPNPFSTSTTIEFELTPTEANNTIEIEIYNMVGQKVKTISKAFFPAGKHKVLWDGTDGAHNLVPSGLYIISFKSDKFRFKHKTLFLK